MVWALIGHNAFPEPDHPGGKNIYMVFAPSGTAFKTTGAHDDKTENDFPGLDTDHAWVGWVDFATLPNTSIMDSLMTVFTHELVEIISDPQPPAGYTFPTGSAAEGSTEIGDVCAGQFGIEDVYQVSSYFSNRLSSCVVPGPLQRRWIVLSEADQYVGTTDTEQGMVTAPSGGQCLHGAYSWFLTSQAKRIVVTSNLMGYIVPVQIWSINGEPYQGGTSLLTFPVDNTVDPLQKFTDLPDETVTLTVQSNGNTLTIDCPKGGGQVDLDIAVVANDVNMPAGYGTDRSNALLTSISGRTRTMDARYYSDMTACILKHVETLQQDAVNVGLAFDKGDPAPDWAQLVLQNVDVSINAATQGISQLAAQLSDPALALAAQVCAPAQLPNKSVKR